MFDAEFGYKETQFGQKGTVPSRHTNFGTNQGDGIRITCLEVNPYKT